ncbi:hypothetical protein M2451_002922 [Dysgonomonas sp. PFB1-18]|uniref:hypothetical protein n=1 Tax=unclassified Dysgonomonas TaxID=2630389 RepID=UPI0013D7DBC7|nr:MULTISPECIES: hypothetical protein [unclassified Dysgonomonas]MDH6310032.1 hypothetical protein [Dysgonomonas sp. PF1-14]MDH6339941.1 hypothetical protein [Dysgonomonas sp. PF1-16]MDH6381589.1 hypothetical protein [Dysgonomonas sp. PFB1-18]MDH6398774.1 hypothetical protein [Dysgonomonas sp. PF1-23]NDV93619.1 hypothetical protein [Dysgonomonas sp. 521]
MKMMKHIISLIFIILSNTSNIYADTGKEYLYSMKYVTFEIDGNWSDEEIKASKDYKNAIICNDFILENYSNIKFPIFLKTCFEIGKEPCCRISYDTYIGGGALNININSYEKMVKEKGILSKIGINLWIHLYESPENILKLLEHAIKQEPKLKKTHKELRKIIKTKGYLTSKEQELLDVE